MDPLALFISQRAVQTFCMSSRPPTRPLLGDPRTQVVCLTESPALRNETLSNERNDTSKVEMLQSRDVQLLPLTSIPAKAMLSQDFQRDRAFKSVVVRRL